MSRILGYTYNAACHCPICTRQDQYYGRIAWGGLSVAEVIASKADEHGIYDTAIDREGNAVRPIFSTDEFPNGPEYCDDCCREIAP